MRIYENDQKIKSACKIDKAMIKIREYGDLNIPSIETLSIDLVSCSCFFILSSILNSSLFWIFKDEKCRIISILLTAQLIDKNNIIFNYNNVKFTKKLCNSKIWANKWKNEKGEKIDLPKNLMKLYQAGYNSLSQSNQILFFCK